MTVAALVVAIASVLTTTLGVFYSWQSVKSARGSELAAKQAAEAAKSQAATWAEQLEIEKRRVHLETTPVLAGTVKRRPIPGRPGMITYQLEVQIKSPQLMKQITINLPSDSWIGAVNASLGVRHYFSYPELGRPPMKLEPGHPASWPVEITKPVPGTIIGIASCHGENGELWNGVEVPITMDDVEYNESS